MLRKVCLVICIFYGSSHFLFAQPSIKLASPLPIPLKLKGSYGEIRNNHYHSGIDLNTGGNTGMAVIAAATGYVSRIKVDEYGFGKALYITHANGLVTVYGHLYRFSPTIDSLVLAEQTKNKKYACELFPEKNKWIVMKGDTIAISGNSGGSGGPHLHFEVRDAATEKPLNPLLYLDPIPDKQPPVLKLLNFYDVQDDGFRIRKFQTVIPKQKSAGNYEIIEPIRAYGKIGVGFAADDFADDDSAILGLSEVTLNAEGNIIFSYALKNFSFDETKNVNGHIDYEQKQLTGRVIERCFKLPGDGFSQYGFIKNEGLLPMDSLIKINILLQLKDGAGNTTTCSFTLIQDKLAKEFQSKQAMDPKGKRFKFDRINTYADDAFKLEIPSGALFRDILFSIKKEPRKSNGYSDTYNLYTENEPMKKSASISIAADHVPERIRKKVTIVRIDKAGTNNAISSTLQGRFISAKISYFGNYTLLADTLPPVVSEIAVGYDPIYKCSIVTMKVSDNLSGIKSYTVEVNNEWYLTEYDYKQKQLIVYLFKEIKGNAMLSINVTDGCDNKLNWRWPVVFK